MFVGALLAVLPILASATVVPRQSAPFGRLHPIDNQDLCVAAASQAAGAQVSLVNCHASSDAASALELWNITTSGSFINTYISLQSDATLCLSGTNAALAGGHYELQKCSRDATRVQMIGRSPEGFMEFADMYCMNKKSDTELDIQDCWSMKDSLKFYAS
ncbi:uncharacterized protein I303_104503 [Kwoniella dejecticola CBS 10117]|uniref:Uncharacterized protein n=1 Tax=Kwoniella dejecticola CBS 10117 TaxID=1296121 RepID=A0A1A6A546_9TREE|nr:uncharacterized protein I303_04519 [Kwoniella dejecticola CBS 10117]OBR85187.1 hypothetical protein I303_04519 [Kwoniella dejecticola CBS 10117]